ncbi:MAG TPA: heparinase II/III family protein [Microlunatus sp.]
MPNSTIETEAAPYALPTDASLPYGRGELTGLLPPSRVRAELGTWDPFPKITDRAGWQAVPAAVRDEALARAEEALTAPWPELRASVFADFHRNGNRSRFELPHFERRKLLRDLVLGACLTDDERFTDPIMDALWSICEESFWGVPAHSFSRRHDQLPLPAVDEPVIDLFAAETGAQVAWSRYLLGDRLAAAGGRAFDERLVAEIDRRLLTPFLDRDDWFWLAKERTGANNWTPWVCSNLLVSTLHGEADVERRAVIASKIIASLDVYVDQLLLDGGCSEGQSYWAVGPAKLIDCLDALYAASNGQLSGFELPKVAALSRYPVAMHVGGRDMIQHADGHGQWLLEASVLHRAGRLLDDQQARRLAVHLRDAPGGRHERAKTNLWRGLSELFEPGFVDAPPTSAPLIKERWFPDLQVLVAREHEASTDGFLLCMKAGNNAEHHNHNDVGGLSVAVDGHHLVIDPGVGVYTKQTFSPQRYELFEMNSDWHSLPIINGLVQSPGETFAAGMTAVDHDGDTVTMTAELAAAWPSDAGITSYRRSATLDRDGHRVVIKDRWQAEVQSLVLPLTFAVPPVVDGDQIWFQLPDGRIDLDLDPTAAVTVEERPLDDPNLRALWGDRIWRLLITPTGPIAAGELSLTFRRGGSD